MASSNHDVHISIVMDGSKADKALDYLAAQLDKVNTKIQEMKKAGIDKSDPEAFKLVKQEQEVLKGFEKEAKVSYKRIADAVKNINANSIASLESFIEQVRRRYNAARPNTEAGQRDMAKMMDWMAKLRARLEELNQLKNTSRTLPELVDAKNAAKSIERLEAVRKEFKLFASTTANADERAAANAYVQEITTRLSEMKTVVMSSAEANDVYTKSLQLLEAAESASANEVRQMISALQQAQKAEGITVATARLYADTENKLKDTLRGKTQTIMSLAEAEYYYARANEVVMEGDKAEVSEINTLIEKMQEAMKVRGLTAGQAKLYAAVISQLKNQISSAASSTEKLVYNEKEVADVIKNINTAPLEKLERAYKMLQQHVKTLDRGTREYVAKSKELEDVKRQLDGVSSSIKTQTSLFDKAINKLAGYLGVFGGFYLVRDQMQKAFQANIDYDEALSNIRKTTGLTAESVAVLADNIKRIDTRTTLNDMNELAYSAGRLGVKGVSDVMGFVRAADEIKIALGEQLGDSSEAIEQIMKITSLMGVQREYGLEESVRRVGSSMNYLTMNSQATAQPIVDFMRRTAGVATQAGMTASELTGLAGAVNALGQNVEMSATSFSKIIVQISKNSDKVIKALKMDAEEAEKFLYDISSGDMMSAFLTVLRKANEAGGLSHLGIIAKDLGSEGQRVVQTLATLSENYSTVERMVRMSNDAFREGVSVTDEYNLKNETTAAKFDKLKKKFSTLFVSNDNVAYIRTLLNELDRVPDAARRLLDDFKPVLEMFKDLILWISKCTWAFSALMQALLMRSVWTFVIKNISSLVIGLRDIRKGFADATFSVRGFANVVKSAQFANVFTAIATIILSIVNYFREAREEARRAIEENLSALDRAKEQSRETTASINVLLNKLQLAEKGTAERNSLIEEINRLYGSYLPNLIQESDEYDTIASKLELVNKQLQLKAVLEARSEREKEIRSKYRPQEENSLEEIRKQAAAGISGGVPTTRSAAVSEIVKRLVQRQEDGSIYGTRFLTAEKDEEGNVVKYLRAVENDEARTRREELTTLFRGVLEQEEFNGLELQSNNYELNTTIVKTLKALQTYLNDIELPRQREIQNARLAFDAETYSMTAKMTDDIVKNFNDAVEKILPDVEQRNNPNGNLGSYNSGTMRTVDAAAGEKQFWIDLKANISKEQRVEREDNAKAFLNIADEYMEYLQGSGARWKAGMPEVDANETDIYKQMRVLVFNTNEYLRVLRTGNIENANNNGGGGGKDQPGDKEYKDIIAKIKDFYERRAQVFERQYATGAITATERNRQLEDNEIQLRGALRGARQRIVGVVSEEEWDKVVKDMESNMPVKTTEDEMLLLKEALQRIVSTGDVRSIGQHIESMATSGKKEDAAKSSELLSEIRLNATKDFTAIQSILRKRYERLLALMLGDNGIGKITEEAQARFEEIGIMFKELTGSSLEELRVAEEKAMSTMQELGRQAVNFDINTVRGFSEWFSAAASKIPELQEEFDKAKEDPAAFARLTELVRTLYYETYRYSEQIDEAIARSADKKRKLWDKMFKQGDYYKQSQQTIRELENQFDYVDRLSAFGYSTRVALQRKVAQSEAEARLEYDLWMNSVAYARAEVKAAEQEVANGVDGAQGRLQNAQQTLEIIEREPDAVRAAAKKAIDDIDALADANKKWLEETVAAMEKFGDDFTPLRGWYEDKGSFLENVFGTKSERQKAFDEAITDIKKAIRDEIKERTRAWMTKILLDKIEKDKEKAAAAEEARERMLREAQITSDMVEIEETRLAALAEINQRYRDSELSAWAEYYEAVQGLQDPYKLTIYPNGPKSREETTGKGLSGIDLRGEQGASSQDFTSNAASGAASAINGAAGAGVLGAGVSSFNKWWQGKLDDRAEKRKRKQEQKEQKKDLDEKLKMTKDATAKETAVVQAAEATKTALVKTSTAAQESAEATKSATEIGLSKTTAAQTNADETSKTSVGMFGKMGRAIAEAWAQGGPYLGPVLAAGVSAAMGALITWIMNMMGHKDSSSNSPSINTKLVSGMLTYDSGNVQSFAVRSFDDGMMPVLADNGKVYSAHAVRGGLGTGLVTSPTLTTIGGAPALVGEEGPEMVIGRETTHALQMNRPDILRIIQEFDRNRSRGRIKTYDEGNVGDYGMAADASMIDIERLNQTIGQLSATLNALQANGITAHINKYGRGGLIDEVSSGIATERRLGMTTRSKTVFGR